MFNERYVLASSSPQRRVLLERLGLDFEVRAVECEEDLDRDESPEAMVERITRAKMAAALAQLPPGLTAASRVICSDTLVALDHHRLGKPADEAAAAAQLRLLSGRDHQVLTGVALSLPRPGLPPEVRYGCSASRVSFIELGPDDIAWHLASGEWRQAAGGYRIQGKASCFIREIKGSPTGVMGLPLELLYGMLSACRGPGPAD